MIVVAYDKSFESVVRNIKHFKALGMDRVYLENTVARPWTKVSRVEIGADSIEGLVKTLKFIVEVQGVDITWFYDLEKGFDGLYKVVPQLPPLGASSFQTLFERHVLPRLHKHTDDLKARYDDALEVEAQVDHLLDHLTVQPEKQS